MDNDIIPNILLTKIPIWWFRYLDGMSLKVISIMLSHTEPNNKLIAFMAGTTPQVVKNTKRKIIDLGLATRELVGTPGNQRAVFTIDLEWNKNKYIEDFQKGLVDKA